MISSKKIILFGYTEFVERVLDLLQSKGIDIAFLIVPTNRKGFHVDIARKAAQKRGVPILFHNHPNRARYIQSLKQALPDLGISASFSHVISEDILNIPRKGCVNVHGTPLPKYRGPHTLNWQIINGEPEGGVTLHYIDEGVDTGDIIDQMVFDIPDGVTANDLKPMMMDLGILLLNKHLEGILEGSSPRIEQDDSDATTYPPRKPDDGLIDFSWPVKEIYNFVRALADPYPGVFYYVNGNKQIINQYLSLEEVTHLKSHFRSIDSLSLGDGRLVPATGPKKNGTLSNDPNPFSLNMDLEKKGQILGHFLFQPLRLNYRESTLKWTGKNNKVDDLDKAIDHAVRFGRRELGLDRIELDC